MGGGGRIAEGGLPLGGQTGDGQPQAIDGRLPLEAVIIGRSRAHLGRRQRSRQGAVAIERQGADVELIRELARAAGLLRAIEAQARGFVALPLVPRCCVYCCRPSRRSGARRLVKLMPKSLKLYEPWPLLP